MLHAQYIVDLEVGRFAGPKSFRARLPCIVLFSDTLQFLNSMTETMLPSAQYITSTSSLQR